MYTLIIAVAAVQGNLIFSIVLTKGTKDLIYACSRR